MHWSVCGLIIFGFAAPSAVVGVPYAIATQGVVVGIFLCILFTVSTVGGSILLLDLSHKHENIKEFKDVGKSIFGSSGEIFGSVIQFLNLFLYFPVAMDVVATAAQGVMDPTFAVCTDYFILGVALLCLMTTQIRQFRNANALAILSFICIIGVAILLIIITSTTTNPDKESVYLFGNPDGNKTVGVYKALLGVTTAVWSYIPSFIMIELAEEVPNKQDMYKAVLLSAVLNMIFYISIGTVVVYNWGWNIDDPIMIVAAWPSDSTASKALNALLFIANIISYALDSVPLTQKVQQYFHPSFEINDWSMSSCFHYLYISMKPWFLGLLLVIISPNVFVTLAYVTALTIPWVSMIYPAACYLKDLEQSDQLNVSLLLGEVHDMDGPYNVNKSNHECDFIIPRQHGKRLSYYLLVLGIATFIICMVAAIGKTAIDELRGSSTIGCNHWYILHDDA